MKEANLKHISKLHQLAGNMHFISFILLWMIIGLKCLDLTVYTLNVEALVHISSLSHL